MPVCGVLTDKVPGVTLQIQQCVHADATSPPSPHTITKYMPAYYAYAPQQEFSNAEGKPDKAKMLEEQTLGMQHQWQQQEAALHSCTPSRCLLPGQSHLFGIGALVLHILWQWCTFMSSEQFW